MIKTSNAEVQLHYSVVSHGNQIFSELTNFFSEHLLSCLNLWYGRVIARDPSIAYQAVYETLKDYCSHPRHYNPEHGSLSRYLELSVDRNIQQIFAKEQHPVNITSRERILSKYFHNERDVEFAKLLMKNKKDLCGFVSLLNTGGYRIGHLLYELNRHRERIGKVLHHALAAMPQESIVHPGKPSHRRSRHMKPSLVLQS